MKSIAGTLLSMKRFGDATIMVQKEENVSGSLALPVTLGLERKLSDISTTYSNKMVSMSSMSKQLAQCKSEDVYQITATPDPRFKLRWSDTPVEIENKLIAYARKQNIDFDQIVEHDCSPPTKRPKCDKSGLFSFMVPTKEKKRYISGDFVKMEVSQYLLEPCFDGIDPLKYWKENTDKYPTLAKLARTYLTVPATSAPVERLFSIARKAFRPDRCRLGDSTFQMLMMIKCNENKI